MPKIKQLSADDIVSSLQGLGFEIARQKGSHIKLVRQTALQKQVLTIPAHKHLKKGTIKAIFNQASKFIPQEELMEVFYTEQ